jgi:DNA polymerase II large subunit
VGYAHPYFHAAKRRNCFHPETKLWYEDESGVVHHERVDEFVERYLDESSAERDDFGTLVSELEAEVRVPSLSEDGSQSLRPVEAVSEHPAPDHMIRIRTNSGRELTITPDHRVHVYDAELDEIVPVEARELEDDDNLVTPDHLDSLERSTIHRRFDLLEEFIDSSVVEADRLMIKGMEKGRLYDLFADRLADDWDGAFYPLQSTAEHLGLTKKALSNYLYRESLPVALLGEFFETDEELLEFVPDDVVLGVKRDRTEIDRIVELNERVATLLGYYAAEGFAREQSTPKGTIHQTTICGTEPESREFFLDVLREEFGVEPYEENHAKVTTSGRLLRAFFDTVLDAGVHARTKRVPQCVFDASDEVVGAYLSGYFSGDGTVDANALAVGATTVSPELREDVVALLTRLGIKAHVERIDPVPLHRKFPDYYEIDDYTMSAPSFVVRVRSSEAARFHERVGFHLPRKADRLRGHVESVTPRKTRVFDGGSDDYLLDRITSLDIVESDVDSVYCLTVPETNSLVANDVSINQCDGDEDCVMLLMDGLLNFSKSFLPDQRGGKMDAPLVMSSRIDPTEIDDEAHNMDVVERYPREFYEATLRMADPDEVDVEIAEASLGTDGEYTGFRHTHDTTDIALGPDLSAYKTLEDMQKKMDGQLNLARKIRAVDETDVAERIIEYHFLPDLIGNLRAFSRQETRCLDCGEKYRRMPLTGDCRECGGRVNLTVHKGSVNKYMQTARTVADEFGCREYTKQRLEILERALESVFEDDTNRQSGIADFM